MRTIYKYPVEITEKLEVAMPSDSEILSLQIQHELPCVWALVNPENEISTRRFRWFGTGHPIEKGEDLIYVGTIQIQGGILVFHLFEVI